MALVLLGLLITLLPPCARATRVEASESLPVVTGDSTLDGAERIALAVLAHNQRSGMHLAAPFYDSAWVRDSFAWGMVPWAGPAGGPLADYSSSELRAWLSQQRQDGRWITNPWSGWYDETPILIAAIADAFRVNGDRGLLRTALPEAERAWRRLATSDVPATHGAGYLLYAAVGQHVTAVGPHVAADWADQVARSGFATEIEALWYHATRSMAGLERAAGKGKEAAFYAQYASGIARAINAQTWVTGAPLARHAPPATAFGHYTGWPGPRDYFELDSNFLCLLYGIASPAQAASIMAFTEQHAAYLLTTRQGGMPARVLYGDYEPEDYASLHDKLEDETYQNAYWPSVGSLVAMSYARYGRGATSLALLHQIARGLLREGNVHEWYRGDGTPAGAAYYQWPARLYLVALYTAYLGLGTAWDDGTGSIPRYTACLGGGSALMERYGVRMVLHAQQERGKNRCRVLAAPLR